jgi:hypothetical protein
MAGPKNGLISAISFTIIILMSHIVYYNYVLFKFRIKMKMEGKSNLLNESLTERVSNYLFSVYENMNFELPEHMRYKSDTDEMEKIFKKEKIRKIQKMEEFLKNEPENKE